MISVSNETLAKINSKAQLPDTNSEPILIAILGNTGNERDISDYIESGSISSSFDDYIYSANLTTVKYLDLDRPTVNFYPGEKLTLKVKFGANSEEEIPLCVIYLDEINWDADSQTFNISGRNAIGHFIKETSMGDMVELSGLSHEVLPQILEHAGVTDYFVTIGTYEWNYQFKSSDTTESAIEDVCSIFPEDGYGQPGFGMMETPSGQVVVGYWRDRCGPEGRLPTGTFTFNIWTDVFSRDVKLNNDKCYSQVYANGKNPSGVDLEQVIVPVENISGWIIPQNKIYFANFDGATTQDTLQRWAQEVAKELKNTGFVEEFNGPFRPQLTVGDVGVIVGNLWSKSGAITSITHEIGVKGFSTSFTVDSGKLYEATTGWSVALRNRGYNRRQKLADLVRQINDQVTTDKLNKYDPVVVEEQKYDQESGAAIETKTERNTMKVVYDGRNWQNLVTATGGNTNSGGDSSGTES